MPDTTGLDISAAPRRSPAFTSHEEFIQGDEHDMGRRTSAGQGETTGPDDAPEQLSGGGPTRTESDSLGSMQIPAGVYWGIHTARALINFPISRFARAEACFTIARPFTRSL